MAIVKRIVCLANSRKLQGRCVAGIELVGGERRGWIRPVSAREHEEVSEYERQYPDGSDPRPLDIIDVPLLEPRARGYQQENWLIDPDSYWERIGKASWRDLARRGSSRVSLARWPPYLQRTARQDPTAFDGWRSRLSSTIASRAVRSFGFQPR